MMFRITLTVCDSHRIAPNENNCQMYDDFTDSLEGDMSIPTSRKNTTQPGAPHFNTLDEPIKDTFV